MKPGHMAAPVGTQLRPGNWKRLWMSGIVQIELGVIGVILGPASGATFYRSFHTAVISPIWAGILFFIVAGIFGILSGVRREACAVTAYMVTSILTCLAAFYVVGFSTAAIADCPHCHFPWANHVAIHGALIALGVIEFIVAIIGASLTCSAVCKPASTPTVVYYQPQPIVIIEGPPQSVVFKPATAV